MAGAGSSEARIGFIGIGNMGRPMAANLAAAGWHVTVCDADPKRAEAFAAETGGAWVADPGELGQSCNIVITMLPDGKIVRKVVLGDDGRSGLAGSMAKGGVIIDMSSSSPVGTRDLKADLDRHGIELLDAPVSGGVKRAVSGQLAIMVGGDAEVAEANRPLFEAMGTPIHVGPIGAGHAAKVLNNMVSAAGMAAAAEAVVVGERFGIEPETLVGVFNASTGKNNATENKFRQFILNEAYDSGFALSLMVKDLSLAMEVARACDVPAELSGACLKVWNDADASLGAGADHTEIARHVRPSGGAGKSR